MQAGFVVDTVSEVSAFPRTSFAQPPIWQQTGARSSTRRQIEVEGKIDPTAQPARTAGQGREGSARCHERERPRAAHFVIRLLIVDDSPLMRRLLGGVFTAEGDFEIAFARNGVEALEQLQAFGPDVVTLDVNMPEMDGLACLDRIMLEHPCPVVMVSSSRRRCERHPGGARAWRRRFHHEAGGAVSLEMELLPPGSSRRSAPHRGPVCPAASRLAERVRLRSGWRSLHLLRTPTACA